MCTDLDHCLTQKLQRLGEDKFNIKLSNTRLKYVEKDPISKNQY